MPPPSQIRWRLLPSLARSVGLGPVSCPPKLLLSSCHRPPHVTSQSAPCVPASPAGRSESVARYQLLASRAIAANSSCRSHSPSLAAASPKGCHCAGQIQCPRDMPGLLNAAFHPLGFALCTGINGSIRFHNLSGSNSMAIEHFRPEPILTISLVCMETRWFLCRHHAGDALQVVD